MSPKRTTPTDDPRLERIRRLVIVALFADDVLYEKLVLKGGNALSLVHGIGSRSSVDIDISIEDDFADLDDARARPFAAVEQTFREADLHAFDLRFESRPRQPHEDPRWGGYELRFKVIAQDQVSSLGDDLSAMRRRAETVAPGQKRTFKVEVSRYEHTDGKVEVEFDNYTIFVYSLDMIAIEKLRALCQQMETYTRAKRLPGRPRPRDVYDLVVIDREHGLNLATAKNQALACEIFAAKDVPLDLLSRLPEVRDFHRSGWDSVVQTVREPLAAFDVYFDAVVELAEPLLNARG